MGGTFIPNKTEKYFTELGMGNVEGEAGFNSFGRQKDFDSADVPRLLWSKKDDYTPPTQGRVHQFSSTSVEDKAQVVESGSFSTVTEVVNNLFEITDNSATFIANGVAVGDKIIDTTAVDHSIVVSVDSETQLTIQYWHDHKRVTADNSYKVVQMIGTGCGVVHVFGLDSNGYKQREFIIMNGVTNVPTNLTHLRMNRIHADLTGTSNRNVGDISAIADVDGTTTAFMLAGDGSTLQSFYTVPVGYRSQVTNVTLAARRPGTTSRAMVSAELRITKFIPHGNIQIIDDTYSVSLEGNSAKTTQYSPYKVFEQRTDIWLEIDYVTDNNMNISGGFGIIEVKED